MASTSAQLRALAHPLRLRMLSLLTGTDLTAAEVARELGITHANASYHLRFLLDAGELVISGEESIRGGRARRYHHRWRPEERPHPAPPGADADDSPASRDAAQELFVRAAVDELQRRYRDRRRGLGNVVTDAELWVEPETYAQARDLLVRASALLHEGARPPHTDGTERVNLSLFAFLMEPG